MAEDTFEVLVLGDHGAVYMVRCGPLERYHGGVDWTCECKAFQFGRGKYCKHIRRAQAAWAKRSKR